MEFLLIFLSQQRDTTNFLSKYYTEWQQNICCLKIYTDTHILQRHIFKIFSLYEAQFKGWKTNGTNKSMLLKICQTNLKII